MDQVQINRPRFTDTHCHLASDRFSGDLTDTIANARSLGVERMITLATGLDDIEKNITICEKFSDVYCCMGLHPCNVHESPDDSFQYLNEWALHPKCVAIGETGLDYFHSPPKGWNEEKYHARQREFLYKHFELAHNLGKNIVIHTRDKIGSQSLNDALDIYQEFSATVNAVFHCFLGPWVNAERIMNLGGYLSFTGIATFKSADDCIKSAARVPAGKIMVETDAPFLAPTPYRGKRNEPAYVHLVANKIAAARSESLEEFSIHTERTTDTFFFDL